MIVEKILQEELEELRKDLIAKYQELGMRSTGEWERGLETEVIHRDRGYSGVRLYVLYAVGSSRGQDATSGSNIGVDRGEGVKTSGGEDEGINISLSHSKEDREGRNKTVSGRRSSSVCRCGNYRGSYPANYG